MSAVAAYALPWGGAFILALDLPHPYGLLPGSFAVETPVNQTFDVFGLVLSLAGGVLFWAVFALPLAALHLALVVGGRRWGRRSWDRNPAATRVMSASLGLLGGLLLFLQWRHPGTFELAGFNYYRPPLAGPALISSAVAGVVAGIFLTTQWQDAAVDPPIETQGETWPPPPNITID